MSTPIITVENLGKKYLIRHERQEKYSTLRDQISKTTNNLIKYLRHENYKSENEREEFWALKDVSFEVNQGDRIGIIGRNGAGKSTLLKILSRITEPTTGKVRLKGRVVSLLEVGTGFHPELSGRENIFLNGAILGMTRAEIKKKFDEIVAFAEVEKFLDTPVKHYSSGMYVRLAFAVAAHLESEILLVDEVLAVGDAEFQKKCLGKMEDAASQKGRTIIFVSHNLIALQNLCNKICHIKNGTLVNQGTTKHIIDSYLTDEKTNLLNYSWFDSSKPQENDYVKIQTVQLLPKEINFINSINVETPFDIEITFTNKTPNTFINLSLVLNKTTGETIFNIVTKSILLNLGEHKSVCQIPANLLNNGCYYIDLYYVKEMTAVLFKAANLFSFEIKDCEREGQWYGEWIGAIRPKLKFSLEKMQ